jgi:hypothetical protein
MDYYASNSTNCYERIINYIYFEIPVLLIRFEYGDFEDMMFNSSYLGKNSSNMAWVCMDSVENFYFFSKARYAEFTNFTALLLGFF